MIFIDSTIWDAAKHKRDKNHELADRILKEIATGVHGRPVVTDYVMDEVLTWLNRHVNHAAAVEVACFFFDAAQVEIEKVDWVVIRKAQDFFEKKDYLSFTDATTAVVMEERKIKKIATFDSDFERLGFKVIGR